jgi:hypothetical protein
MAALLLGGFSAAATAAPFAFQPIALQRVDLPSTVTSAGWPVFAHDGKHLLFYSTSANTAGGNTGSGSGAALWITDLHGKGARCLTCGLANDPSSQGEGEITPFSDGKRVFFGSFFQPGASSYGVLECSPSVVDCKSASVLPVDFSAAEPTTIPPGGVESLSQANLGGAYAAKLAQDDKHVGFSDIRADSIEMMVVGSLTRSDSGYAVTDPKVINPQGPTSPSDTSIDRWSAGGALYEFKTFTHGGADATYVQSGGPDTNPDVWSVNLATGKRTRLTKHPDYDEDNAGSPDGSLLALWSNRTMHITDWFSGLLPVRDFINTPAALMSLSFSSSNKRCHGPIWILPSSGDRGGTLAGQPIVDYRTPHVFVTNNLTGWPQWSPDGTMLALNTTNNTAGTGYPAHAPYLLVARFAARKRTRPLPAVSSEPGAWAVAPTAYHTTFGFGGTKTFAGPGGGTVTVDYGAGMGVLTGQWSESYAHYSDDGKSFVSGTVTIDETGPTEGTVAVDLTMTGAHKGSTRVTLNTAGSAAGTSTLDGHTVTGPSPEQAGKGACPSIQPKEPKLRLSVKRAGAAYRVKVTASVGSMGPNEAHVDTRPVYRATVKVGSRTARTNAAGIAQIKARRGQKLTVTAGNTLAPASLGRLP